MTHTRATALSRSMPWMIVIALTAVFTLVVASLLGNDAGAQEDGVEDGNGSEQSDADAETSDDEADASDDGGDDADDGPDGSDTDDSGDDSGDGGSENDDTEACEGRHGKRGSHGGRGLLGMKSDLGGADLAALIGIEQAELREALKSGMSLADVATANGVDPQVLVDAIVEAINAKVDELVEAGVIDDDKAEEMRSMAAERAEAKVNHSWSADDDGKRRRGHGRRGFSLSETSGAAA